jgi:Protein of unknown function (DUF4232)
MRYDSNVRRSQLVTATVFAAAVLAATASGHTTANACTGTSLAGRFSVIPGSAGAGNISYELRLRNIGRTTCTVTGLPLGRLLGRSKRPLPTHVRPAQRGALTAVLVRLAPGQATVATARFSPDVPGPGEGTVGACERTAYWFRVTAPAGGTTLAEVAPPTPVCEHGTLFFSAYGRKR